MVSPSTWYVDCMNFYSEGRSSPPLDLFFQGCNLSHTSSSCPASETWQAFYDLSVPWWGCGIYKTRQWIEFSFIMVNYISSETMCQRWALWPNLSLVNLHRLQLHFNGVKINHLIRVVFSMHFSIPQSTNRVVELISFNRSKLAVWSSVRCQNCMKRFLQTVTALFLLFIFM